jgi:hypothetical protein
VGADADATVPVAGYAGWLFLFIFKSSCFASRFVLLCFCPLVLWLSSDVRGVLAEWSRRYCTMDQRYEADTLRVFGKFVAQGCVEYKLMTVRLRDGNSF